MLSAASLHQYWQPPAPSHPQVQQQRHFLVPVLHPEGTPRSVTSAVPFPRGPWIPCTEALRQMQNRFQLSIGCFQNPTHIPQPGHAQQSQSQSFFKVVQVNFFKFSCSHTEFKRSLIYLVLGLQVLRQHVIACQILQRHWCVLSALSPRCLEWLHICYILEIFDSYCRPLTHNNLQSNSWLHLL